MPVRSPNQLLGARREDAKVEEAIIYVDSDATSVCSSSKVICVLASTCRFQLANQGARKHSLMQLQMMMWLKLRLQCFQSTAI